MSERSRVATGTKGNKEDGEGFNKPDSKKKETKMKKLMIAAAAAAMIGGVQADELCTETAAGSNCSVYNVKFTFKTISGKARNCAQYLIEGAGLARVNQGVWTRYMTAVLPNPVVWGAAREAQYARNSTAWGGIANGPLVNQAYYDAWVGAGEPYTAGSLTWEAGHAPAGAGLAAVWYGDLYWADNATRTLEGLLWQCDASCFEAAQVFNDKGSGEIYFALWEKKTQKVFSYPAFRYYTSKDKSSFKWITADEQPFFNWMGRYGAKAEKIGVSWTPNLKRYTWDNINAVGFGTYDVKNLHMKSVTGGAIARLEPFVNGQEDQCGNGSFKIQVAYVCEEFKAWCCDPCYAAVDWVPAYGNWSLKYNASLSKGKTPLSKILPSYAIFSETGDAAFTLGYDNKGIFHWYTDAPDPIFTPVGNPAGFYADQNCVGSPAAGTPVRAFSTPALGAVNPIIEAGQAASRAAKL